MCGYFARCYRKKKKKRAARPGKEGRKEMFYLTTHSTQVNYGYMASDICLRTILIVRKETRCRLIGYSFRLTARVILYAPSHRQDSTYHGLCYTSRGALAGTRNSSTGPPHEGSIRRPIAPRANVLTAARPGNPDGSIDGAAVGMNAVGLPQTDSTIDATNPVYSVPFRL